MEHQAAGLERRDDLARAPHIGEHRLGAEHARERFGIRTLDRLVEGKARRRPVDMRHRRAVSGEIAREAFEADIDDAQRTREQRADRHARA
jgi:hypothetical protein